jgi:putative peptidoglycan lipid II flippase
MAGLIMLRVPIVNLLLEHGEFNRISTIGTASALLYYSVGLWAFAGVRIVSQAYYSLQDTRTPVRIALLALATNIVLSVAFIQTPLQHGGLALATSLSAMLNLGLLTKRLRKKIGRMDGRRILASLVKIVPSSLVMGAIGWWVSRNPMWDSPGNTLVKIEWLGGGMAVSVLFYIVAMWALRSEELAFLWGMVKRKTRQGDGETR